nr:MAG TPA: hypothetical protein [Caudoviricetes sp.]
MFRFTQRKMSLRVSQMIYQIEIDTSRIYLVFQ